MAKPEANDALIIKCAGKLTVTSIHGLRMVLSEEI